MSTTALDVFSREFRKEALTHGTVACEYIAKLCARSPHVSSADMISYCINRVSVAHRKLITNELPGDSVSRVSESKFLSLPVTNLVAISEIISYLDSYKNVSNLINKDNLERLCLAFERIDCAEYAEDFAGAIRWLTFDKILDQKIFDDLIAAAAPLAGSKPGERVWHTAMGLRRLGLEGAAMLQKHRAEIIAAGTGAERLAIEIVGKKRFGIPTSDDLNIKIRELKKQCRAAAPGEKTAMAASAIDSPTESLRRAISGGGSVPDLAHSPRIAECRAAGVEPSVLETGIIDREVISLAAAIKIQKKSKLMNQINRFFHAIARFFSKITNLFKRKSKLSTEALEVLEVLGEREILIKLDGYELPQYKLDAISEIICAMKNSYRPHTELLTTESFTVLIRFFASSVENSKQAKDFATAMKWLSYDGILSAEIFASLQSQPDGVEAAWYVAAGLRHLQLVNPALFQQHWQGIIKAGFKAERLAVEITDKERTDARSKIQTSSELRHHISVLEQQLKTAEEFSPQAKAAIRRVKIKQWFARICPAIFKTTTADRRDDADSTPPSPVVGGGRLPLPPSPPGGMGWGGSSPVHGAYFGDGFDYGVAPPPSRGGASRAAPAR